MFFFFFSSRRRHTRCSRDWSSDVCSSDLDRTETDAAGRRACPGFRVTRRCGMRWLVEFYNERRGILARYGIEASLPAAAALLGRNALLAEHPPARARRGLSFFGRAGRVGGAGGRGGGPST